jgi:hypothetical protein
MSLQLISKLNLHFFENISMHAVVRNDDTRDSALAAFNQVINQFKPTTPEERAIADFFRDSFANNQHATLMYLRRMNYLGLSQFISGRCVAMALGIENKIHIVTDKSGCYVSKISNRRGGGRRGGRGDGDSDRRDDRRGDSDRRDRRGDDDRRGGNGDRRGDDDDQRDGDRRGGRGGGRDGDRRGRRDGRKDGRRGDAPDAPFKQRVPFNMDALVGTIQWPIPGAPGISWADMADDDEFDTPPTPPTKSDPAPPSTTPPTSPIKSDPAPPATPSMTPATPAKPLPLPLPELE